MRILVFFDLPVQTVTQRKTATQFRNFLLKDGFSMVQFSVYSRIISGSESVEKHINRIDCKKPECGSIRVLTVTEKQYENMIVILGIPKEKEKSPYTQMSMFF